MRSLSIGILALASMGGSSCARDSSYLPIEYSVGDGEPVLGAKVSFTVAPEFSGQDTQDLFDSLKTEDLRAVLASVACGETVPDFKFTVPLWRQAPMHVRHVEVRETPWLEVGRKNECLVGGMKFFVTKTIERIERQRRQETSATPRMQVPGSDVGGGLKGVRCDCEARSKHLPSVRYDHWPIS
jgi:hypothetical protein